MSCTPPSFCAAPVLVSMRMSPASRSSVACALDFAPMSWNPCFTPWIRYGTILHTEPLSFTVPLTPCATFRCPLSDRYRVSEPFAIASRLPIPRYFLTRAPSGAKKYSPGASVVPANIEPHIAALAPSASAFTTCPEFWIPPSAKIGTPNCAARRAHLYTAVACPRPTAHTSCVVQMEPLPMPTRRPSAPASSRRLACACVTTLPAMTSTPGTSSFRKRTMAIWYVLSPCDESRMMASRPSAASALARALSPSRVPTAAPQNKRPCLSTVGAPGGGRSFLSFTDERVMRPTSSPAAFTTQSFPRLEATSAFSKSSIASVALPTSRSFTGVMTDATVAARLDTSSWSRLVHRPSRAPPIKPVSVTTTLVNPRLVLSWSRKDSGVFGVTTSGRTTYPSL
mmetsp:Transcript_11303/g.48238  ORF Transcript_11303/g.48238 Transcript_11303/m.48238 type:complete len:397 (-) Transcript_11303:359-1549(-)